MPSPIQDITITNIPIMGITAIVVPRFLDLVTVTGIMAAIGGGYPAYGWHHGYGGYRGGYGNGWHHGFGGFRGGFHGGFHR